jgi:hypothetical protein
MATSSDPPEVRLKKLYSVVGDCVVLPIPKGKKGPVISNWQNITFAQSIEPAHQKKLLACFEHGGNLGIVLGPASYDLVAIDIDEDHYVTSFLGLNPALRETLRTRAKRGCQLWLRMEGDYPEYGVLKSADGSKAGEWRSQGHDDSGQLKGYQSVIYGVHPDKNGDGSPIEYKVVVAKHPVKIRFSQIVWPEWIARPLPWDKPASPPPPERKADAGEDNLDTRIRAYLAKIPPAESGNGGHDATFKVACSLIHGWALLVDEARPYLADYSARCKPPWTAKELEHKLADAAKATSTKPRGYLRDAPGPQPAKPAKAPSSEPATTSPAQMSRGSPPTDPSGRDCRWP